MDNKIVVFCSGKGSNLQAIINAIKFKKVSYEIEFVLSNNSEAGALSIAKNENIKNFHISEKKFSGKSYIDNLIDILNGFKPDLIVLAGYMKKIPAEIINLYPERILNIHPALLPKYGGKNMYGMNVHTAIFENREKYSGISIHLVNEEYDKGKIIYQETVNITDCNSPEEIAKKVLKIEHEKYPVIIDKYLKDINK